MQVERIQRDENGHAVCDENGNIRKSFIPFGEISIRTAIFKCPRHGEIPTKILYINGEEQPSICPVCDREVEISKEQKAELQRKRFARERQIALYRDMNVEQEYWDKTIDDYKPMVKSQERAKSAVERLIARKKGKVILLGKNGCGKTHLGSVAVKALGGKVLTMYEIATMIRQSYSSLAVKSELAIVSELAEIPMLFIDEMGRSKGSSAELNWLSYILDKRHQRGLPFMIGTNSHLAKDCPNGPLHCEQCFEKFLGSDIISRLMQDSELVTLYDAPDYRSMKK